jgi:hypothetical protein
MTIETTGSPVMLSYESDQQKKSMAKVALGIHSKQ